MNMNINFANWLMTQPLHARFIRTTTPRGKAIDGLMVDFTWNSIVLVRRLDGGKDFWQDIKKVDYR
jgi:hypothetical protein